MPDHDLGKGCSPAAGTNDDAGLLELVIERLRELSGVDFSGYRRATLRRRVGNRMIMAGVPTLRAYYDRLGSDEGEAERLLERLTIKVSRFFRDAASFRVLRRALEERGAAVPSERPLEIWSAGCGQGEEPYSLAMLLEEIGRRGRVIATDIDIDDSALAAARQARYPSSSLVEVPGPIRGRYFEELEVAGKQLFSVRPEVRQRVLFRRHDLTANTDPLPGERVGFDLICCRNVLIYFEPGLQEQVQRQLQERLLPGGFLCLGEAEWLLPSRRAGFEVYDRKRRVFRAARAEAAAERWWREVGWRFS